MNSVQNCVVALDITDVGDLMEASVHRLGCYEDGKIRSGLWRLCSGDGSATGTSLDSSFTSVLMVASVPVTSQAHHNLIFFAGCHPPSCVLSLR